MGNIWTSLASGAGGLLGSIVTGITGAISSNKDRKAQNAAIDKQIAAQQSENQRARDFEANQARLQNQWNIEQWQRENDYNSPTNQRDRLIAAGYNPDLAYGNLDMSSASSPAMTSASNGYPTDMSALANKVSPSAGTFGAISAASAQMANIAADVRLKNSQADKNEADARSSSANARSTDSQTDYFLSVQDIRKSLEQGELHTQFLDWQLTNSAIEKTWSDVNLTKAQIFKVRGELREIDARIENLNASTSNFVASTKNLDEETLSKKIENSWKNSVIRKQLEYLSSSIGLNIAQTKDIFNTFLHRVALMDAQAFASDSAANYNVFQVRRGNLFLQLDYTNKALQNTNLRNQNEYLRLNIDLDKEWKPKLNRMSVITGYINSASNAVNALSNMTNSVTSLLKGMPIKNVSTPLSYGTPPPPMW